MYAGADWAGNGWFAAFLTADGKCETDFYPTVWNLWHDRGPEIDRMLLDIPIGLCDTKKRKCDEQAKEHLNVPRQRSGSQSC